MTPGSQPGDHYVDSNIGSDSNPGTQAQPWRTIQRAADSLEPGETVLVNAGHYDERVKILISGREGAPIAFQAVGSVQMNGFTINANYISIQGFYITDTPDNDIDGMGIFVSGSHCKIANNHVFFATRGGLFLDSASSECQVTNNQLERNSQFGIEVHGNQHTISDNEIWGTIQYHPNWLNPPSWVDADGIRFFGSGHIFRGNYIHDISFYDPENIDPHIDGFQTWDGQGYQAGTNCTFENNRIVLPAGNGHHETAGFQLEGGVQNIIIKNNIVMAFVGVNAYKNGNPPYTTPSDISVWNNDFIGDLGYRSLGHPAGIEMEDVTNTSIENNIFANQPSQVVYTANSSGVTADYNLAYNSDGTLPDGSIQAHDLWGVNPEFLDLINGDYHLQMKSPAIDAGIALPEVTTDFDGIPRPQRQAYDIGAYEFK